MAHRERRPRVHTTGRLGIPYQRKDVIGPPRGARRTMPTETRWHSRGQVLGPPGRTRTTCTEMPYRRRPSEAARCGLPHLSQCLLRSGAQIATRVAAAQAEQAKTNKYGKVKGGVGVTGISLQLNGRSDPGLDVLLRKLAEYKRPIIKTVGRDGGRPLQEWQKLLSIALARYTAATVLSATGHKASFRECLLIISCGNSVVTAARALIQDASFS